MEILNLIGSLLLLIIVVVFAGFAIVTCLYVLGFLAVVGLALWGGQLAATGNMVGLLLFIPATAIAVFMGKA